MTVLDGQSQITNCMFEILAQEAQEEQGKIQIFMDPDFSSIIDYLRPLLSEPQPADWAYLLHG